jgi:hypothetical protein
MFCIGEDFALVEMFCIGEDKIILKGMLFLFYIKAEPHILVFLMEVDTNSMNSCNCQPLSVKEYTTE